MNAIVIRALAALLGSVPLGTYEPAGQGNRGPRGKATAKKRNKAWAIRRNH